MQDKPKRPRGRPAGPPKPPKTPKPMGRPTVWDKQHGPSVAHPVRAPERFFELWEDFEFRKRISDLMLDYEPRS